MTSRLISIVIPTLNEFRGIRKTIEEITISVKELEIEGFSCEILVVDGGSIDGTVEIARKLGAKVIIEPRRGYGRGYKTGFRHAIGDIIVTLDGDGSYPSKCIPKLIKILTENNYDFITTNRFACMEPEAMSFLHKVGNKFLTYLVKALFDININDSQSGMWIFKRDILKHIMPESDGMSFSEEIKIKAFLNVKCIEVPIPYRKRLGKPKLKTFRDGISNLIYLFILWFKTMPPKRR